MGKGKNFNAKIIYIVFVFLIIALVFNVSILTLTGWGMVSFKNIRAFSAERGGGQVSEIKQARRGSIYTSDNQLVATDVTKYKLIAILSEERVTANGDPAYVKEKKKTAKALSTIINMSYEDILAKLETDAYQVEFGSAGKNLTSLKKEEIESLGLPGLVFEEVVSRNYRYADFASYEVGYAAVNEKDPYTLVGQMGLEQSYNDYLKGSNGEKIYLVDAHQNELPDSVIKESVALPGNDVYMTINSSLQTELDALFKDLIKQRRCYKGGCAIMEVKTGRILAITNYPSFDPNERDIKNYLDTFINEAFECGSVFKAFVYGNGLTDKTIKLKEKYMSGGYRYYEAGRLIHTIRDYNEGRGWGKITFEEGFYHSSNTAICHLLAEHLDMQSVIETYKKLGLFQASEIDGMTSGSGVKGYDGQTKSLEYLTTGFGQGSSVTGLQLLRAYSTFANDGKMVEPHLVDKVVNPLTGEELYKAEVKTSEQIFSTSAVKQMRDLLYGVVNRPEATGYRYHLDDIELIGKTGTGQVAENGRYHKTKESHVFVGLAPYDDPQIEIVCWYQSKIQGTKPMQTLVKSMVKSSLNLLNGKEKKVKTKTYTLTSFINQSTKHVKSLLKEKDLEPVIIGNGSAVKDQYPAKKTKVAAGSRVFLLTDGKRITMPDMTGWSRKDAEAFANLAKIEIEVDGAGTIYRQSVRKGMTLTEGKNVKVYAK